MKILIVVLTLIAASSQFACRPLAAGAVGAAVGVAVERDRQEDKRDREREEQQRLEEQQRRN